MCVYFHNRLSMFSICFLVLFMLFVDKLCFLGLWISFFLTYEKEQWQNRSSCESNSPCEAVDFRRSIGKMLGFWLKMLLTKCGRINFISDHQDDIAFLGSGIPT